VGIGGSRIEELRDVRVTVAPFDLEHAKALISDGDIEDGSGGVAHALLALSRLALAYPQIESVDVNPLIVTADRAIAVDALVVVDERC
jgi:succinyl-CoA synthetase beta subunit